MSQKVPRIEVTCPKCNTTFHATQNRIDSGRGKYCSRSCAISMQQTKHGHWGTPTYSSWHLMRQRCSNRNNPKFPIYGGRSISVCDRWDEFDNFLADMGERPEGMTLDRIDVDGDYTPENCRWATPKEQQNNMRSNVLVEYEGHEYTMSELAEQLGVKRATLDYRIKSGWPRSQWGAAQHSVYNKS